MRFNGGRKQKLHILVLCAHFSCSLMLKMVFWGKKRDKNLQEG